MPAVTKNTRDKQQWGLARVWNDTLDRPNTFDAKERNYIWASELGWSFYDRYYKMKGRKATTPPNYRARRKFEAGNLTEWAVKQVLVRAGIYLGSQDYVQYESERMNVTGRLDFIAGGKVLPADYSDLPDIFGSIAEAAVARLTESYPDGLRKQILEIKSCSGVMFERYLIAPNPNHVLQAFHYAHNLNLPANIVYISRDDFRVTEWAILPDEPRLLKKYLADIDKMADIFERDDPPKEPLLEYNPYKKRFSKNPRVEYSNYLTDYGFERPDLYAEKAGKIATRLNNAVKRIKTGKELTKLNIEAIELGLDFYPEIQPILNKLQGK